MVSGAATPRPSRHWGRCEAALLDDPVRFAAYARAHHVAAHHWALWRVEEPFGPVGLALKLPRSVDPMAAPEVEATAVLVEALAVECVRDFGVRADFGVTEDDVDWQAMVANIEDARRQAGQRGCRRWAAHAAQVLTEPGWPRQMAWHAMREWTEIAALADALGHGRVLERDEAVALLSPW